MSEISRRDILSKASALSLLGAVGLSACSTIETKPISKKDASKSFVTVNGQNFYLNGERYTYAGANIWYGAYLGATASYGNRERLVRELDEMKSIGITNLRVLASSELSPLNNSLDPAFTENGKPYNENLLKGIDFLLDEMAKRDMKAVLYLTNFWEWSGGLTAYQYYTKGKLVHANDPNHPWPAFADWSANFYKDEAAKQMYYDYTKFILNRTNSINNIPYKDDPTIMAWQLCNEPRTAGDEKNHDANLPYYLDWIKTTAALIRSIDKNHLVSLGHESLQGANNRRSTIIAAHEHIDYTTSHIWPQNWSWVDPKNLSGTWEGGLAKVKKYISDGIDISKELNKPLVFEEFGFPRDEGNFKDGTPTVWRDKFYSEIYTAVEEATKTGGPVAGTNFWAWGGTGRAEHADFVLRRGETAYIGDPPHEPQGWYSVFNNDESTKAIIKAHAKAISK